MQGSSSMSENHNALAHDYISILISYSNIRYTHKFIKRKVLYR